MSDIRTAVRMEAGRENGEGPIDLFTGLAAGYCAGLNFAVAIVEGQIARLVLFWIWATGWGCNRAARRVQPVQNITADDGAGIALGERFRKLGRFDGAGSLEIVQQQRHLAVAPAHDRRCLPPLPDFELRSESLVLVIVHGSKKNGVHRDHWRAARTRQEFRTGSGRRLCVQRLEALFPLTGFDQRTPWTTEVKIETTVRLVGPQF